ncbi:2-isopropylmalate synthase [Actinomadura livida]|uniref:2-isopropylmalate synthase n=1 Tax=Actinomadura livida TaxID=79909 RepID=A0A7W7MVA4_9ACTN|nr:MULTISPECIES: 2-isopropylmalate synthase [Actinomadura]MBB4772431.1 2-isopropylmalate synthase [Actinomadura catellatispora]GGU23003.1 2-isopropylmalate synthase [Actinomadura livida]
MNSHQRYRAFNRVELPDRTWPTRMVTRAPRWLSSDLRDGNQALARPMSPERKLLLFELITDMGYKEIEVGFPAASRDDHDFVRLLVGKDLVPDDVRITVGTPARPDLIRRTVTALAGARSATICVFNATAPLARRLVYGIDRDECRELAVRGATTLLRDAEELLGDCDLGFEYTLEMFNETEPDFALEVCEAVMDVWQPGPGRETVLNLPSTVERSGPHFFADQVEWMNRNLSRREHICLSVHPHNDRGTAVAAAELAVAAGADRVEGCLFGNGERTGNVCLVTLGLNLFSQGVDPRIDFSDLDRIRRTYEYCTRQTVHPRHPYAGDLVYTTFAGTHQDAIGKGLAALDDTGTDAGPAEWNMPYLPIDPRDVGRSYEAVVRVTSQSGKGGVAYMMRAWHSLNLPSGLRDDFAKVVQARSEATGGEVGPMELWRLFNDRYMVPGSGDAPAGADVRLHVDGRTALIGPADREELARRLRSAHGAVDVRFVETALPPVPTGVLARGEGGSKFAVYAECRTPDGRRTWGAGLADDPQTAAAAAISAAAHAHTRNGHHAVPAA